MPLRMSVARTELHYTLFLTHSLSWVFGECGDGSVVVGAVVVFFPIHFTDIGLMVDFCVLHFVYIGTCTQTHPHHITDETRERVSGRLCAANQIER